MESRHTGHPYYARHKPVMNANAEKYDALEGRDAPTV